MNHRRNRYEKPASRDELVATAQDIATYGAKKLPLRGRIVVVVTDAAGNHVGVGAIAHGQRDVEAILRSAIGATDRKPVIIETEGFEA